MAEETIVVRQTRSSIRKHNSQLATLKALGLGRIGRVVEHKRDPEILGMLRKVSHLIEIVK